VRGRAFTRSTAR
jgi:hypothetical protein